MVVDIVFFRKGFSQYTLFSYVPNFLIVLMTLFPVFSLNKKFGPLFYILPLFILLYQLPIGSSIISNKAYVSKLIKTANETHVTIMPINQERPLNYIEECIKPSDPLTIRAGTSAEIIFHYLYKTILPYPMSYYYGYKFISPQKITDPIPLISLSIYLVLLIMAFYLLKRNPAISFGLFIYLICIVSFCNFLIPVPGMLSDRFLLIPSIGWLIIFVSVLFIFFKKSSVKNLALNNLPAIPKYIFLLFLSLYSVITFSRNLDWKDYLTLFRKDIKYVDNSSQAHNLLALRLMKTSYDLTDANEQLRYRQEAAVHFRRAIDIYPDFFNATYDLGRVYSILEKPDSALIYFQKATALNPDFPSAFNAVGQLLSQQNKFKEAVPYYRQLIKLQPAEYNGYDRLGLMFFMQKDYPAALEVMSEATKKMPVRIEPYISSGRIYYAMGLPDSARLSWQKALTIDPQNMEAQSLLHSISK